MVRNIVLLVCTTAVLVILFVGYRQLVRAPAASEARSQSVVDELPDGSRVALGDEVAVAHVEHGSVFAHLGAEDHTRVSQGESRQ